ncbi:hypothetical protein ACFWC6_30810 [Micromonospora chalcea]
MTTLPAWVYDVTIELLDQRDTHPRLLFESGAFEGTRQYDWCPCKPLERIPAEVVAQAEAIRTYKAQTRPSP